MAKVTTRDAFRVIVTGSIDLPAPDGVRIQLRVKDALIYPQRLGDFGWVSMSDRMASDNIEAGYERRCREIVQALRDHYPDLKAETQWDTAETCSHCGLVWEEFTAVDLARYPDWDDPVGLPQCCDKAQVEWRAAQAVSS
jgi:hypothetical protein